MSLYFDGMISCDLRPDAPQQIIDTLQYMVRTEEYIFDSPPDHEFFEDDDWRDWMRDKSACAPGNMGCEFRKVYRFTHYGIDQYRHTLGFRRCMHDDVDFYECWWSFIQWLAPYSETEGFVGYYREQYSLHPTLVYFKDGNVYLNEVVRAPVDVFGAKPWSAEKAK